MRALTSGWGVAKVMQDPPRARVLRPLVVSGTTTPEVVARVAILAALHDVPGYDELTEIAKKHANQWPRFVARSLTEPDLPELKMFLSSASIVVYVAVTAAARDRALPFEVACVDSAEGFAERERPYESCAPKRGYLDQLLGEKTAAQMFGTDTAPTPQTTVPTPGAGTSRRLGRHTSILAKNSAYIPNKHLTPLGRTPARATRLADIARSNVRARTSALTELNASQTMKKIAESTRRKTVTVLDDNEMLPAPPDSLKARQQRKMAVAQRKAAQAESAKSRKLAREARSAENKRKKVQRKLEARKVHKEEQAARHRYDLDDPTDDDYEGMDAAARGSSDEESLQNSPRTKRNKSTVSEPVVIDLDGPDSPPQKRSRTFGADEDEMRVPRVKPGRPRTGEEAFRARAALSNNRSRAAEWQPPAPPPYVSQNATPPTTPPAPLRNASKPATPNAPRTNGQSFARPANGHRPIEMPQEFGKAVGQFRDNLTPQDVREICDFVTDENNYPDLFKEGEQTKEYVLKEYDKYSLVLRLQRNGTWQRVRYTNI